MAKKTIVSILDDLDETPDAQPVAFSIDAVNYTIDLAADNEQKLRNLLAPYIAVATKVRQTPSPGRTFTRRTPERSRDENKAVRDWAAANGVTIAARGRIAEKVIQAFENKDVAALREFAGVPEPEPQVEEKPVPRKRAPKKAPQPEFSEANS